MTLLQLMNIARATIPGAKPNVIDDTTLILLLNNATTDIVVNTKCLPTNKKFNVVASQQTYSLTSAIGNFLLPDKSGLWWNNGTQFTQLYAKTLKWLDRNYGNWRSLDVGNPIYYTIDGDLITVVQTPNTSLASGFWLYYIAAPTFMASPGDFPFVGNAVEQPRLRVFDEAIMKYAKWKISPMINQDTQQDMTKLDYDAELLSKKKIFHERPDVVSEAKMQGPNVC
jgi:hypothetical protein